MDKQNKKAIQSKNDLDDLIKSIKAEDINSGQIEESAEIDFLQKELAFYQSLTQQQQKFIEKLLDAIRGSKEQLEKMETRIDETNTKLSSLVPGLANH